MNRNAFATRAAGVAEAINIVVTMSYPKEVASSARVRAQQALAILVGQLQFGKYAYWRPNTIALTSPSRGPRGTPRRLALIPADVT